MENFLVLLYVNWIQFFIESFYGIVTNISEFNLVLLLHENLWLKYILVPYRKSNEWWIMCIKSKEGSKFYSVSNYLKFLMFLFPLEWYTFCQAMGLISIVVFLPGLMVNFFYTMHPKGKMFRGLRTFNFILTFITGKQLVLICYIW